MLFGVAPRGRSPPRSLWISTGAASASAESWLAIAGSTDHQCSWKVPSSSGEKRAASSSDQPSRAFGVGWNGCPATSAFSAHRKRVSPWEVPCDRCAAMRREESTTRPTSSATAGTPPPASRAISAARVAASRGGGAAGGSQDSAVQALSGSISSPAGRPKTLFLGAADLRLACGSDSG